MQVSTTRRYVNQWGFMGIALADILANGVAVIILLIVIVIADKYQAEQDKLEQTDEVAVVLSRDLANSVVMNNLAASAPAVLHDYQGSPLDANPDHSVMPILEMHSSGVRHFYTGEFWSRAEMLIRNNKLDRYLNNLNETQRASIRIDIYEITQFYLLMSIVKEQGISLLHWHFSVYEDLDSAAGQNRRSTDAQNLNQLLGDILQGDEEGTQERSEGDGQGSGESGDYSERNATAGSNSGDAGLLPGSYNPLRSPYRGSGYPLDTQLLGLEQGQRAGSQSASSGSASRSTNASNDASAPPKQRRVRLATEEAFRQGFRAGLPEDEEQLLQGLMSTLKHLQGLVDLGQSPVRDTRVMVSLLLQFAKQPLPFSDVESQRLNGLLYYISQRLPPFNLSDTLPLEVLQRKSSTYPRLLLSPNTPLFSANLEHSEDKPRQSPQRINIMLNHFPEIYQGLNVELMGGSLLVTPEYQGTRDAQWRAVAFIYPRFDDFVIGYVYASLAEDGSLILPAEENGVSLNGYPWSHVANDSPGRGFQIVLWLLSAVLGLVLLLLYLRRRRG